MEYPVKWNVVLVAPGEDEVSLLAELSSRVDARLVAVIDPAGDSLGTAIAEIMGVPIFADLGDPALREAEYLVYPAGFPLADFLDRQADQVGLIPLSNREFNRRFCRSTLTQRSAPAPPQNFESLERETETIHRTLSRIEEALQRESLLRWLLSLATRAVRATSGSIMLYDEKTRELYIAFAYGLSESTQHATRLALGEGIAGRVAQKRCSELVRGRDEARLDTSSDRPDIVAAISSPLQWEEQLLGVLNVSVAEGNPDLTDDDLATVDRLARRIGLILHRFLDLQKAQTGEMFRATDRALQELMLKTDDLQTVLAAWASTLAITLESTSCSLAVVCDDGSLLVAEGRFDGETSIGYETTQNHAWNEVQQTGSPLVVRQAETGTEERGGLTVFYLPVGSDPVLAVLTVVFGTAVEAHRFHELSGEILYLLEKRLVELLRRVTQQDRLERLTELTTDLTGIAAASSQEAANRQRLVTEIARRLTGAREVYLVTELDGPRVQLHGDERVPDSWLAGAGRLLREACVDGWRVTVLSDVNAPRLEETCLLAVPASRETPTPGLILRGKHRRHALDGATFTAFDASLVQRLARLLQAPSPAKPETPGPLPTVPESRPEAEPIASAAPEPVTTTQRETMLEVLCREMDRCDRYHTTFALTAFRPQYRGWDLTAARDVVRKLAESVRSSDFVTCLEDGTLLVIVPEDVQSLSRQQRRLSSLMRDLTGLADLQIAISYTIYPGRYEDSTRLLDETLAALGKAS